MTKQVNQKDKSLEETLAALYQGEVFGEAFFGQLMKRFQSPDELYKLGSMLQLETETKARIRPVAAAYGVDLAEQIDEQKRGMQLAEIIEGGTWEALIIGLVAPMKDAVARYREFADKMPPQLTDFGSMILAHEQALYDFFAKEAAGDREHSLDAVIDMLQNPLPKPKPKPRE